jgi:hypothetical protein
MSGTVALFPPRVRPQEWLPDGDQHRRQLAQVLGNVSKGAIDCTLSLTLQPNSATTTFIDPRISLSTAVVMVPTTATAATEAGAGALYAVPEKGQVVIHHANSAVATRTFTLALIG